MGFCVSKKFAKQKHPYAYGQDLKANVVQSIGMWSLFASLLPRIKKRFFLSIEWAEVSIFFMYTINTRAQTIISWEKAYAVKPEPQATVLCRGFFQLKNTRAMDLFYLWYTPGHMLMSYDLLVGYFSSHPCMASACNCNARTDSPCLRSPKWLERYFFTCIRQLTNGSGG